jgi:uncharacterized protein (DUF433 family)/DNA-binding transcriptional MerR regulator
MDERVALTGERIVESGVVTKRQLDWWAKRRLVEPSVSRRAGRYRVRLYSLAEAVEVAVVAHLRRRGVSLQEIRRLVDYLRTEGVQHPLRELRWATDAGRLYFQRADGSWYGPHRPAQGVIDEVLDLDEVRGRLMAAVERPSVSVGRTERRRGVLGGQEVVAGTRIPVATVERRLAHGHSDDQIIRAYPDLRRRDVAAIRERSIGAVANIA